MKKKTLVQLFIQGYVYTLFTRDTIFNRALSNIFMKPKEIIHVSTVSFEGHLTIK